MRNVVLLVVLSIWLGLATQPAAFAQNGSGFTEAMITAAELSNFERTSTFAEVVSVVTALQASSPLVHRETLLTSLEGKKVPLLVLADLNRSYLLNP